MIRFSLFIMTLLLVSACSSGGGGNSCALDFDCAEGQYCNFSDFSCGAAGAPGNCAEIPTTACGAEVANVCSCDGLTFINECYAGLAGQSIQSAGECA